MKTVLYALLLVLLIINVAFVANAIFDLTDYGNNLMFSIIGFVFLLVAQPLILIGLNIAFYCFVKRGTYLFLSLNGLVSLIGILSGYLGMVVNAGYFYVPDVGTLVVTVLLLFLNIFPLLILAMIFLLIDISRKNQISPSMQK